jgi:hypothetical protein
MDIEDATSLTCTYRYFESGKLLRLTRLRAEMYHGYEYSFNQALDMVEAAIQYFEIDLSSGATRLYVCASKVIAFGTLTGNESQVSRPFGWIFLKPV